MSFTAVNTERPNCRQLTGVILVSLTTALLAFAVQAQTTKPAAPAQGTFSPTVSVAAVPKYAAKDIERAFGFIDINKDGKISREEAVGFRGVARHFDKADIDKDGMLSREEFGSALNQGKSR